MIFFQIDLISVDIVYKVECSAHGFAVQQWVSVFSIKTINHKFHCAHDVQIWMQEPGLTLHPHTTCIDPANVELATVDIDEQ